MSGDIGRNTYMRAARSGPRGTESKFDGPYQNNTHRRPGLVSQDVSRKVCTGPTGSYPTTRLAAPDGMTSWVQGLFICAFTFSRDGSGRHVSRRSRDLGVGLRTESTDAVTCCCSWLSCNANRAIAYQDAVIRGGPGRIRATSSVGAPEAGPLAPHCSRQTALRSG